MKLGIASRMITSEHYPVLDFWFYEVGVNVVPVDSRSKSTSNRWSAEQNEGMKSQDYEQMKKDGEFVKGAAVVTGKVWRGSNTGCYLAGIDFDNKVAIDSFLQEYKIGDKVPTLEELAKYMLLEQHSDSSDNKLHAYAYSKHPLKNKGSDKGKAWFKEERMPAIEVKGTKSLMFCTPSMHAGGHRYEFLNTILPPVTEELENVINKILKAHDIEYLDKNDKKTRQMLDKLDGKKIVGEGSRHNSLLTKMNAMLHDLIRIKPVEEIKQKCIEFNNLYCNPPLPIDEFERMWNDAYVHVVEIESDKDAVSTDTGGVMIDDLISVETAKRLNSGCYAVKGMIIQVSNVIQMVVSTDFKCDSCGKTDTESYNPPLFSLPSDMQVGKVTRERCDSCGKRETFEVTGHKEIPAIRIQLQDEKKQDALEGLDVVLFGKDTLNIRAGENCMVFGELHVIQQSKNARVTYLFANREGGSIEYERPEAKEIEITAEDLQKLNEFQKLPDMIQQLTNMFAPNIIGYEDKKLAVILMYIGAPETEHFRGRIHGLFIGPPGTAKTTLASEAKKLGYPNSRFSSTQGASVKSITAIIDKDNDTYVLRLGVLPQAKNSLCVLDEVASLLMDEQKYLLGAMEEGRFTIDKYGFHREIEAPTTVLGTTNPETSDWFNNVIAKNQIPLRKELVDRYDFVLAFQATTRQEDKRQYAEKRLDIVEKFNDNAFVDAVATDYTFLQKFIQHAKTFSPVEISEEAKAMIIDYWSKLDNRIFPTNRVLETIRRTSIAFARLHFSNVVTVGIAKEATDFITGIFSEFDKTIVLVQDPRDVAYEEIIKYLREIPGLVHEFKECLNHAAHSNTLVETYIGPKIDVNSHQYRDIADRFKQHTINVEGGKICQESIRPLKLVFRKEQKTEQKTEENKESGGQQYERRL
jgi:DNA replicative helicase MCM subunit Mcm2 (Cdc46/Mcm family)